MSETQRVIKYIANTFAIILATFIIVSIISLIIGITSFFTSNNNQLKDINITDNGIYSIKMNMKNSDLKIVESDKLYIKSNKDSLKISNSNGVLKINEDISVKNSKVIIGLSKDVKNLDIDVAFGKVTLVKNDIDHLKIDLGLGKVVIKTSTINKRAHIDVGMGKIDISALKVYNLDTDLGIGACLFDGDLFGNNKIEVGIGSGKVSLKNDDYKVKGDIGLGSIKYNEHSLKDNKEIGNGNHTIDLDLGIGKIRVDSK